jgi:hypothetical protein
VHVVELNILEGHPIEHFLDAGGRSIFTVGARQQGTHEPVQGTKSVIGAPPEVEAL